MVDVVNIENENQFRDLIKKVLTDIFYEKEVLEYSLLYLYKEHRSSREQKQLEFVVRFLKNAGFLNVSHYKEDKLSLSQKGVSYLFECGTLESIFNSIK